LSLKEAFAFLAEILPDRNRSQVQGPSPYLLSSEFRRLAIRHRGALTKNRIPVPEPADYPGERFLVGMSETLASITTWLETNG